MILTGSMLLLSILVIAITIIPLSSSDVWWVRAMEFPRFIFAAFGLLLALLIPLLLPLSEFSTQLMLISVLASTFYHVWRMIPYTPLYPKQVLEGRDDDPANTIRIMISNVLQSNKNYQGLLEIVHDNDPDLLVTLESNQQWQEQLDKLEYPFSIKCPLENLYGMHVYAKYRLIDAKIQYLTEKDIPSMHTKIELPSGERITSHFLHPLPPRPRHKNTNQRDAELLIVGKSMLEEKGPRIISGDLNDVAWSRTTRLFLKTTKLLDPRIGRGMFNTFKADNWLTRWPLDHLFHSHHFTLKRIERLPKFGSDHFPVLIELILEKDKRHQQKVPIADEVEENEAREKMNKKDVSPSDVHRP